MARNIFGSWDDFKKRMDFEKKEGESEIRG